MNAYTSVASGTVQISQDPKTARSLRIFLSVSALFLTTPFVFLISYGLSAFGRFVQAGETSAAVGVLASFLVVGLSYSSLLMFAFSVQQMRVSPAGVRPQFRPWRHLMREYTVSWAEVARIELAEPDAIIPARSIVVRLKSGRMFTIPTRTFPDEPALLAFVRDMTPKLVAQ